MTWNIWLCKTCTGDPIELVASYSNRGQAIAKLRGILRKHITSELVFCLRRG